MSLAMAKRLVSDAASVREFNTDIETGDWCPHEVGACTDFLVVWNAEHVA